MTSHDAIVLPFTRRNGPPTLDTFIVDDPDYDQEPLSLVPHPGYTESAVRAVRCDALPGNALRRSRKGPSLADTIHHLRRWHAFLGASYARNTVKMYWGTAWRFLGFVTKALDEVTEDDVAQFIETFPYRSAARATYYRGLMNLFDWCVRNGIRPDNPVRAFPAPKPTEHVPRALSVEQVEAIRAAAYAHAPQRGYAVDLLYFSAARISEALAIRWDDLTDEGVLLRKTKNGKERLVPWNDGLRAAVEGLRAFYGERDRVLPRCAQTVGHWLHEAGQEAGVTNVHPHLFRSTAATRMLVNGARPHAVKAFLGHSKITTTQVYWAVEQEDVKEAGNLL